MILQTKRALTYLEILAGIAIISFILFGMNTIFGIGINNNRKTVKLNIALGLAQELMEEIKAKDFQEINNNYTPIPLNGFSTFARSFDITDINENKKRIGVIVSEPGIADVELSCLVSNPDPA